MADDEAPDVEPSYRGPCQVCGAVADGMWPHPLGDPCPLSLDAHEREQDRRDLANDAYIAKLNAEAEAAAAFPEKFRLMVEAMQGGVMANG